VSETIQSRPIGLAERVLAPDLARGVMLLFIALANSHYFLQGSSYLAGFPTDGSVVDAVVAGAIATLVDGRAFPLFGVLFGYGVVQIVRRQQEAGLEWRSIRRLVRRRSRWMILIGFVHCVLLYVGDIIAAYGFLALVFVPAVRWRARTLLVIAVVVLVLLSSVSGSDPALTAPPDPTLLPPDPVTAIVGRASAFPLLVPFEALGLLVPFLVGVVAARHRLLEDPARHVVLLRRVAVVGIGAAVAGGLPLGLAVAGAFPAPDRGVLHLFASVQDATGYLGGPGYAAGIALLAARIGSVRGPLTRAVAAVGQRSMTCYLSQSVVWALVFAPYLLDLSDDLSVTGTAVLAVATWLGTVGLAELMRRRDARGPAELLLRRLT
jgi:uncharacterized protein